MRQTTETRNRSYTAIFAVVLIAGFGLRIYQHFFTGRPLWEDEAHLALNFIDGGYLEMFMPLKNFQSAPVIFLLGVETMSNLFGFGEVALRLFPFAISVLTYPLFYYFVRDMTASRPTALVAFILFSFNAYIIQYASELKPYTVEMSAAIGLGYLTFATHRYVTAHREKLLKIFGALALFAANTSFIVLFVIVCYRISYLQTARRTNTVADYEIARLFNKRLFKVWGIAFFACIILNIIINPYADNMRELWKAHFIPVNIFSIEFWTFMQNRLDNIFFSTVFMFADVPTSGWALTIILIMGVVYMILTRKFTWILFCVLPVFMHCFLSWAQLYPLYDRFLLYLAPAVYAWMALAVVFIARLLAGRIHGIIAVVWISAVCVFVLQPSAATYPLVDRNVKPCLDFINRYPANMKLFTTTPKTLYEYYLKTGYVRNKTREEVLSGLTIEQYQEQVGKRPLGYMLLHSATDIDRTAHIIAYLDSAGSIADRLEYGTYRVVLVRP